MAGQLNGQLWFVVQGIGDDDIDGHLNANGTNITTVFDNIPAVPGAGFQQGGSDLSIGLDLPNGLYFVVNSDGLSISVHNITTGALIDTLQIGDFNGSTANQDIVNSLVVDPNNHVVYVGRWGETRAESGIVAVSYTTAGDLDNNQAYNSIAGQTRLVDGNDPGVITDVRYMDLSNNNQILYYTDNDNNYLNNTNATFPATNAIFRIDLTNPAAGATKLSDQAQFPTNLSNGLIGTVTADEEDGIIYFTTHQFNAGGPNTGQDALWWMPIAGGTATKITLPANALHYAGEWGGLSYDRQTGQLYITDVDDPDFADPLDRHIVQLQMSADGKSVTSVVNTFTTDQLVGHATGVDDPNSYPQGTSFDLLPIITVTGTATHAPEQGANPAGFIDLTTVATSVTDADNNFLASATVQITGGTFTTATANESSANDDHLSVNDGGTFKTTGTFTGTSITISYDSATEKLTLSGVDTLAHYQTVLNAVSFNTTGDNPTDYGLHNTRTVTWTLSDGAPNVPDGGQNQTTTTLTIDAQNDGPNVFVGGGNSASMALTESNSGFNQNRSLSITDPDSLTETLTLTNFSKSGPVGSLLDATLQGFFSVPSTVNIVQTTGSASFNWTFNSGTEAFNFLAVGETLTLNYTIHDVDSNDSNGPGSASLSDDQAISVTVAGTNDAPTVTGGTTQSLAAVFEDSGPAGQTVSALLGSHFADVDDNAALTGIAIVSNGTSASGKWQWSTNGSSWTDVGTASDASAVLVHTASFVRFLPATDFNGTAPALSVRLVDDTKTAFVDGATQNVSTNGGTTPYSTGTVALNESVTAVNDAPNVINGTTVTLTAINEDNFASAGQTVSALYATHFSDADDNQVASGGSSPNNFAGVAVVGNAATAAQGQWEISVNGGGSWSPIATTYSDSSALQLSPTTLIRFVPAADFNGPAPALTVRLIEDTVAPFTSGDVQNLTGLIGDPGSYSATTIATSETINPINDAPTVINGGTTTLAAVNEDNAGPPGATVTSLFNSHFSDATDQVTGGSTANTLAGIAITANAATATEGTWQWLNGAVWTNISTGVSDASALVLTAATQLRFLPTSNWNGTTPTLTAHLIDNSVAISNNSTVDLSGVGATGGTTQYSTATVALSESVNAVNDAPTVFNGTTSSLAAVNEDATSPTGDTVSTLFANHFLDATDTVSGGSTANNFAGVAVTNNAETTQGSWQWLNGAVWTDIPSGNIAATALLLSGGTQLRFLPGTDFNGAVPALTVHLVDDSLGTLSSGVTVDLSGGGSTGGATRYSSGTVTLDTSVTAVNDAPNVVGATVSLTAINEDNTNPAGQDVSALYATHFSDADDNVSGGSTPNNFAGIAITGNAETTEGHWQYSLVAGGPWINIGTAVSDANALLLTTAPFLRFLPAPDFNGAAPTLTVRLTEDTAAAFSSGDSRDLTGLTGDPGSYSASTIATSETINPVNDAPTGITVQGGGSLSVAEFGTGGSANGTVVGTVVAQDIDNTSFTYSLTDDASGRFTINTTTGVITVLDGTKLDYEQVTSHSITVQASDGVAPPVTQAFIVTVTNVDPETVFGDGNANTFVGGALNDKLFGNGGIDNLSGGDGNDILHGGTGADVMNGGLGSDVFYVDDVGDAVTESDPNPATGGADAVITSVSYTIPTNVEWMFMNGAGLTGTGSNGADTFADFGGANTFVGLGGNDTYYVDNAGDVVIEGDANPATGGIDTVITSVSFTLPTNVEFMVINGAGLTATGSSGADIFFDSGGANTFVGLGGNDTYYIDNAGDVVTETDANPATGGVDGVVTSVSYTIPTNVELMLMNGTGLTGTGSNGADIFGDFGGANTFIGLGGNDTYYIDNAGDVVIEGDANPATGGTDTVITSVSFTMPTNVEFMVMNGAGLTGTGSSGADIFFDLGGANTFVGLGGNDTYYVDNVGDVVTETDANPATGGTDGVVTSVSFTIPTNVEMMFMNGTGLTGTGSNGADIFADFGGANTFVGLGGNDTYYINNVGDVVTEGDANPATGGTDTVITSVSFTIPTNVEMMEINGTGLTGTGSSGADIFFDLGGANTFVGLGGNDTYYVDNAGDVVTETDANPATGGTDSIVTSVSRTISANVEFMYMNGNGLTGTGSAGNDTLSSLGQNTLIGNGGDDTFMFFAGSADSNHVVDFSGNGPAAGDHLEFHGFGPGATFSQVGASNVWELAYNGGAAHEFITFDNNASIHASDFIFV